jgi:hypothetical protein
LQLARLSTTGHCRVTQKSRATAPATLFGKAIWASQIRLREVWTGSRNQTFRTSRRHMDPNPLLKRRPVFSGNGERLPAPTRPGAGQTGPRSSFCMHLRGQSSSVETIQVYYLGPCGHEIAQELLLWIRHSPRALHAGEGSTRPSLKTCRCVTHRLRPAVLFPILHPIPDRPP